MIRHMSDLELEVLQQPPYYLLYYRSGVVVLYDISYVWSGTGGALVTTIVSLIFSLLLGMVSINISAIDQTDVKVL